MAEASNPRIALILELMRAAEGAVRMPVTLADAGAAAGEQFGRTIGLPEQWINDVRPYAQLGTRLVTGPLSEPLQNAVLPYVATLPPYVNPRGQQ